MAFLLGACTGLAGCAQQAAHESPATPEARQGAVFGRVEFHQEGKEVLWTRSPFDDELTLFVRAAGTSRIQHFDIEGDGSFFWPLQPGEYELVGFQVTRKAIRGPSSPGRLMLKFSVPSAEQAGYVGDLRIERAKDRYRFAVLDREGAARERFGERLSSAKLQASKVLMLLEDDGRFKQITPICGGSWGIECTQVHRGVTPLQPDATAWSFSEVRTLTPLLEWQPPRRSGLAYDVAIYESLSFSFGWRSVSGLRGTRVAYAEGLREPRYTPPPLKPGKQYEWTVRLRNGETVSEWSTTGYAFWAVVAWGSSSGRFFGIATPQQ